MLKTKRFTAKGNQQNRDFGDLEMIPAKRLAGRIELPAGQALPPHATIALDRDPAWDLVSAPVKPDGSFVFEGLAPETYTVRVVVKGFEIDSTHIGYQMLGDTSFGLHLTDSIANLRIPLATATAKEPPNSALHPGGGELTMSTTWLESLDSTDVQAGVLLWLIKLTLLLLVAALTASLVQRRSPGLAHRIWIWAVAGVCVLPLLGSVAPPWGLPMGATYVKNVEVAIGTAPIQEMKDSSGSGAIEESRTIYDKPLNQNRRTTLPSASLVVADQTTNVSLGKVSQNPQSMPSASIGAEPTHPHIGLFQSLCVIWAVGAGLLLIRLGAAVVLVVRLTRRAARTSGFARNCL